VHTIADDYNAIESQAGSEQYQAVNCSIAYRSTGREPGDGRLLNAADFE
jgi:hypothetical protein